MNKDKLIAIQIVCVHYDIEMSFIDALHNIGLLHIDVIEQDPFIHQDQVRVLEKILRIHNELNINLEGIDAVFNLLENERLLRDELSRLKNKLKLYEP